MERINNKENQIQKKFVSYKEGAEMYSLGLNTFQKLAKEAGACYKIWKRVICSCEKIDTYLNTYKL